MTTFIEVVRFTHGCFDIFKDVRLCTVFVV